MIHQVKKIIMPKSWIHSWKFLKVLAAAQHTEHILIGDNIQTILRVVLWNAGSVYHLNTLLPKPCANQVFFFIFTRIWILKDVAITTIKFCLVRSRKKNLLLSVYTPNLHNQDETSINDNTKKVKSTDLQENYKIFHFHESCLQNS